MTRIGVLSDTHITEGSGQKLPEKMLRDFRSVDLIIHAGDWVDLCVMDQLSPLAEVRGVFGNMDGPAVRYHWPEIDCFSLDGFNIGIIHGWGPKEGLEYRILKKFPDPPDLIIFGHTHVPLSQKIGEVLVFNPGAPLGRAHNNRNTYGIITLGDSIRTEIVPTLP